MWRLNGYSSAVHLSKGRLDFVRSRGITALLLGLGAMTAALLAAPSAKADTRRDLCVQGATVEIKVGSSWYEGTVIQSNPTDESCAIRNTSYTGREMIFHMAPDRMRAAGLAPRGQVFPKAADPRCVPGATVEIKIGSSWYDGTVVQSHPTDGSCVIRNTSYSGREMLFDATGDRFRAPAAEPAPVPVPQIVPRPAMQPEKPPGTAPRQTARRAAAPRPRVIEVIATVEEIGKAYAGNTPAAREKYEKKTVQLTGTLQRVSDDSIVLSDGPFGKAMCAFAPQERAQLSALQPGSTVTVVGEESWWGWDWFNLSGCQVVQASSPQAQPSPPATPSRKTKADSGPPAGRYVCRQYMTTMGYLTLHPGGRYEVKGVEGRYRHHADTGEVEWLSGSYEDWGWKARYDYRSAASLERPQDEHIIRMTDDQGKLRIDCFLMRS